MLHGMIKTMFSLPTTLVVQVEHMVGCVCLSRQ